MGQNLKHIFKFTDPTTDTFMHTKATSTAAPELQPIIDSFKRHASGKVDYPQLVDVVNDFEWTHTNPSGRREIPYVRMSEYSVEFSTLLQNIRFMLTQGVESVYNVYSATRIDDILNPAQKKLRKMADKATAKDAPDGVKKTVAQGLKNLTDGADRAMISRTCFSRAPGTLPSYLRPYYGLYGTMATGFEYAFPYFEQQWKEVAPRWTEYKGGGGLLSTIVNELFSQEGLGKEILEMTKLAPGVKGTYIERPYEYQYGQDLPTWTFSFHLLNTRDWTDVVKNWQLCYLLSYQNLPNKTTKTLLDPPVIYEVEVPGVFYSPYAYMSRISIVNKGAMRLAKVPVLKGKNQIEEFKLTSNENGPMNNIDRQGWKDRKANILPTKSLETENQIQEAMGIMTNAGKKWDHTGTEEVVIETLVPDAYEIQITIQSLIPESKNLLFHSILGPAARASGMYNVSMKNPDKLLNPDVGRSANSPLQ